MTQKEIAKLLNVSQPTVSMALKGSERISPSLREAVRNLAAHSGYRPNLAGQLLRQGRSNVIGAVFPSLTNGFYAELFQELQRRFLPHGYLLHLSQAESAEELAATADSLRRMQVAGVIAIGSAAGTLLPLRDEGIALVFYGGDTELDCGASQVLPDRYHAAAEVMNYLFKQGRRHIAFLGATYDIEPRFRAYREAVAAAGLPEVVIRSNGLGASMESGCRMMEQLLREHPEIDAVFCHKDELAIGALRAAVKAGIRLPEQIALCGFDGIEAGEFTTPPLTSVEQPRREITASLVAELLAVLADPKHCRFVSIPCRLIVRESA